jgi:arsenate reductase (thioredoxin)
MTVQVLILCTHNAARSQLAEATLRHWAQALGADLVAHSAGSAPSGQVHPLALLALQTAGIATEGLHSKSWDRFAEPGSPPLDLVITVCDSAAGEACPLWPGAPRRLHWGYPDPSRAPEAERAEAFAATCDAIGARMRALAEQVKAGRLHDIA